MKEPLIALFAMFFGGLLVIVMARVLPDSEKRENSLKAKEDCLIYGYPDIRYSRLSGAYFCANADTAVLLESLRSRP